MSPFVSADEDQPNNSRDIFVFFAKSQCSAGMNMHNAIVWKIVAKEHVNPIVVDHLTAPLVPRA